MKIVPVILVFLMFGGCASPTTAPYRLNVMSKSLTAPNDKALVYIVRPYASYKRFRSPDFSLDGVKIGAIENNRYMYFYALPMVLLLPTRKDGDLETLKIPLVAGTTYFLKFDTIIGYTQLDEHDGRSYLSRLALSNIKPVVVGAASSNLAVDAPSSNLVVDAPSSNPTSAAVSRRLSTEDYLTYDDNTRMGMIRYRANMDQRSAVISKIEEICGTKNVALRAGEAMQSPAAYRTLDENIEKNLIQIRFQCLY